MYIRTKTRKNTSGSIRKYAYLVLTKRRKRSKRHPKQKVSAYLGRVIELNNHQQSTLNNPKQSAKQTIKAMLEELLLSNGFAKAKKDIFIRGDIRVNLFNLVVKSIETGQKLCLQVNEGFISRPTLVQIVRYELPTGTEKVVGQDLVKKLLAVGLKPQKEAFLALYYKISKDFHGK